MTTTCPHSTTSYWIRLPPYRRSGAYGRLTIHNGTFGTPAFTWHAEEVLVTTLIVTARTDHSWYRHSVDCDDNTDRLLVVRCLNKKIIFFNFFIDVFVVTLHNFEVTMPHIDVLQKKIEKNYFLDKTSNNQTTTTKQLLTYQHGCFQDYHDFLRELR
jgi:hypothetical protein